MTEYTPNALHDAVGDAFSRRGWIDDGTAIPALVKAAQAGLTRADKLAQLIPATFLSYNNATRADITGVLAGIFNGDVTVSSPPSSGTVIQVSGGTNVTVAIGSVIGRIENQAGSVPDQEVRQSLLRIANALEADSALSEDERVDALEGVEYLAEQAALPAEQRSRTAIKAVTQKLARTIEVSAALATLWQVAGPPIMKFLGV